MAALHRYLNQNKQTLNIVHIFGTFFIEFGKFSVCEVYSRFNRFEEFLRFSTFLDCDEMSEDCLDPFGEEWTQAEKIWSTVKVRRLFDSEACSVIEAKIEKVVEDAKKGLFRPCTVDKAPLRTKLVLTYNQIARE